MKFNALFSNFSSGEWSEKLVGRSDSEEFDNATLLMENFIPKISGGAFKRNGTIRFQLSNPLRILLDDMAGSQIKCIPWQTTFGDFLLIISSNAAANAGGWLVVSLAFGGTDCTHRIFTTGDATGKISLNPSKIQYAQVGNALVICDGDGSNSLVVARPESSTVFNLSNWETAAVAIDSRKVAEVYPYRPVVALGSGGPVLTTSGTGGSITITSSAAFFNAFHVGAIFKFSSGSSTGVARITAFGSSTSVTASVLETLPLAGAYGLAANTFWEESAWSNFRGWPQCVTVYESRLFFGNNNAQKDTLWGSRINSFFFFMERPYLQDPAFTTFATDNSTAFELKTSNVFNGTIVSIGGKEQLVIVYDRYEAVVSGTQGALGKRDAKFSTVSGFGGSYVQGVVVGNTYTYVGNNRASLREAIFVDSLKEYMSNDLSFVNDLLVNNISEVNAAAYDKVNSAWVIRSLPDFPGVVPVLNSDKQYKQNAWWRFTTDGQVQSCAYFSQKEALGSFPIFAMVVRRQNAPATTLEIEYLTEGSLESYSGPDSPLLFPGCFIDCAQIHTGSLSSGTFTISSLNRMNGKTVTVVMPGTGRKIGEFVVSSNQITFSSSLVPSPVNNMEFVLGYKYSANIQTFPVEIGNQIQNSAQGRVKKVDEVVLKLWKSVGLKYGTSSSNMHDIPNESYINTPLDQPYPLTTETVAVYMDKGYNRQFSVYLSHSEPYPCNILALIARGVTYD